jgi:Ni/Fe-hydrogenase subunit HybB-like protein
MYLLTKGRWGSWLVKGAVILSVYAAVLGLWFLAGVAGADDLVKVLVWIAVPIALATAGYTAFLFGQAEARDLWQSPILLWHMVAGAFAVGGGAGSYPQFAFPAP